MKTLVIGHCDGAHTMLEYIKRALPLAFPDTQFVYQQNPVQTPDILVYSVFGNHHRQYNCRKILMCGEPSDISRHRPNLVIDCKIVPRLRNASCMFCYVPFYVTSFVERFQNRPGDLIKPPHYNAAQIFSTKTKFCAFLYSQNVDFRNNLFDVISRYKPVDALGKARGIPHRVVDRQVYEVGRRTYNDLAVQKYRPYKFVICCENSRHAGYVTEKMLSAMLAQCIPIYLGAPDVVEHFNSSSFINVGAYPNWEHAVARIRELDENPDKYQAMLAEPWFKGNVFNSYFAPDLLVPFLKQLLAQPAQIQIPSVPRALERVVPRVGTVAARNLRSAAHHRIAPLRAVRPTAPKIGSQGHSILRQRLLKRKR
jgi:hypothetical protein